MFEFDIHEAGDEDESGGDGSKDEYLLVPPLVLLDIPEDEVDEVDDPEL